jgi:hypothetical protein
MVPRFDLIIWVDALGDGILRKLRAQANPAPSIFGSSSWTAILNRPIHNNKHQTQSGDGF